MQQWAQTFSKALPAVVFKDNLTSESWLLGKQETKSRAMLQKNEFEQHAVQIHTACLFSDNIL